MKNSTAARLMLMAFLLLAGTFCVTVATVLAEEDCAKVNCAGPVGMACNPCCQECNGQCIPPTDICILEPFPGGPSTIKPSNEPFDAFITYVNNGIWPLLLTMGVSSAVLNGFIGGFQIVTSNGDPGKVTAGRNKLLWSIIGMLFFFLCGVILEFINPFAFKAI